MAQELTDREKEVLTHITAGLMDKEIAATMGISIDGVKKHCKNIYLKLGVNNRTVAAVKYVTEIKDN